jgi:predicted O-methyltransferase YrrM
MEALEASMAALVSELGYPWYVGMLADEGVSTVLDVLVKVGLHSAEEERSRTPEGFPLPADASGKAEFHRSQRSLSATSLSSAGDEPTTREDRLMFVSAYLVSLGFAEMHAAEISEEVVSKYDDARVSGKNKRVLSADRLFQFDTLDGGVDVEEEQGRPTRNFSDSDGEEKHRGPSEEERQTVRRAIAASKARVASRRASRVSHSDHEGTSPTSVRDRLRSNESSGRRLSLDDVVSPPYPEGPRTIPSKNSSKDSGLYLRDDPVEKSTQERVRRGAAGGLCDPNFLRLIKPLYDLHMGAENLGPMLYNLVRFTKPARILEVGAGYTSAFLLQALRDNAVELETYRDLRRVGLAVCGDAPWSVDAFFDREAGDGGGRYRGDDGTMVSHRETAARAPGPDPTSSTRSSFDSERRLSLDERRLSLDERLETRDAPAPAPAPGSEDARVYSGVLHCIDNMAHEHTTAHAVVETARKMRCADRLRLHEADAFDPDLPAILEPGVEFDMLWIDLGAAHRIEGFMEAWWPRVRAEGGMVIVHSTLTNQLSRGWLEKMRELARAPTPCSAYGRFETMSLLEPHKMFQNSITMFQKRGGAFGRYDEPVHTKFP